MTTMCFFVDGSAECALALNIIGESIPCFIRSHYSEVFDAMEIEIKCRVEDVSFVESMLAPFV